MRSILRLSAVALTVFTVAAQSASAQFTQQGSRPVGSTALWGGVTATSTYTIGNVTATSAGGNWAPAPFQAGTSWSGGFTTGDDLLFGFGNSVMTFDFASAIYGFGTQAWYNVGGGPVNLVASYLGNTVGSFSIGTGGSSAPNVNQATIYAFTSTQAIDRVVLTANSEFAVNQLDYVARSPIVTPEPTSAAMLAGALAALGFVVRRRNKRAI